MNKNIVAAVVGDDEAKSFLLIAHPNNAVEARRGGISRERNANMLICTSSWMKMTMMIELVSCRMKIEMRIRCNRMWLLMNLLLHVRANCHAGLVRLREEDAQRGRRRRVLGESARPNKLPGAHALQDAPSHDPLDLLRLVGGPRAASEV